MQTLKKKTKSNPFQSDRSKPSKRISQDKLELFRKLAPRINKYLKEYPPDKPHPVYPCGNVDGKPQICWKPEFGKFIFEGISTSPLIYSDSGDTDKPPVDIVEFEDFHEDGWDLKMAPPHLSKCSSQIYSGPDLDWELDPIENGPVVPRSFTKWNVSNQLLEMSNYVYDDHDIIIDGIGSRWTTAKCHAQYYHFGTRSKKVQVGLSLKGTSVTSGSGGVIFFVELKVSKNGVGVNRNTSWILTEYGNKTTNIDVNIGRQLTISDTIAAGLMDLSLEFTMVSLNKLDEFGFAVIDFDRSYDGNSYTRPDGGIRLNSIVVTDCS